MKRGDVYMVDLGLGKGSEQGGLRPVIVIQNDIGNKYSPTIIVASITGQIQKCKLPTHVLINGQEAGLEKDSVVLMEQIRTIDKSRLIKQVSTLSNNTMSKINKAMMISLGVETRQLVTA